LKTYFLKLKVYFKNIKAYSTITLVTYKPQH